jgi:hypothetical protein
MLKQIPFWVVNLVNLLGPKSGTGYCSARGLLEAEYVGKKKVRQRYKF